MTVQNSITASVILGRSQYDHVEVKNRGAFDLDRFNLPSRLSLFLYKGQMGGLQRLLITELYASDHDLMLSRLEIGISGYGNECNPHYGYHR